MLDGHLAACSRTPASRPRTSARHPRHHARHQRADRAQGRAHRAAHHRRAFATCSRWATRSRFEQYDVVPREAAAAGAARAAPAGRRAHRRADGDVLRAARRSARSTRLARRSKRQGVEAVAVGFLHAYANPRARAARARDPRAARCPASRSRSRAEVCPEIREYERFSHRLRQRLCAAAHGRATWTACERELKRRRLRVPAVPDDLGRRPHHAGDGARASRSAWWNPGPAGGAILAARHRARARARPRCSPSTWAAPPPRSASSTTASREHSRTLRGGARLALPEGQRPAGAHPGDRDGRDRRRRRLDRARGPRCGRIAVGPRAPAPSPARPATAAAASAPTVTDADVVLGRIDPDALRRRARSRSTPGAPNAPCSGATSARALGSMRRWAARWHRRDRRREHGERGARARDRARQGAGRALRLIAFGGAAPLHAGAPRRQARHRARRWCRWRRASARRSASSARRSPLRSCAAATRALDAASTPARSNRAARQRCGARRRRVVARGRRRREPLPSARIGRHALRRPGPRDRGRRCPAARSTPRDAQTLARAASRRAYRAQYRRCDRGRRRRDPDLVGDRRRAAEAHDAGERPRPQTPRSRRRRAAQRVRCRRAGTPAARRRSTGARSLTPGAASRRPGARRRGRRPPRVVPRGLRCRDRRRSAISSLPRDSA